MCVCVCVFKIHTSEKSFIPTHNIWQQKKKKLIFRKIPIRSLKKSKKWKNTIVLGTPLNSIRKGYNALFRIYYSHILLLWQSPHVFRFIYIWNKTLYYKKKKKYVVWWYPIVYTHQIIISLDFRKVLTRNLTPSTLYKVCSHLRLMLYTIYSCRNKFSLSSRLCIVLSTRMWHRFVCAFSG